MPNLQLGIPSSIPEAGKYSTPQISSYSHCTHMSCYSVRFLYKKPALHIMALETNAFLIEINYVPEQRKCLCYCLPGLQPKYLNAAPRHPSEIPVGRFSLEGIPGSTPQQTHYCLIFHRKESPKGISRNNFAASNKNIKGSI